MHATQGQQFSCISSELGSIWSTAVSSVACAQLAERRTSWEDSRCTCAYKYLARLLPILQQRPPLLLAQLCCRTTEQHVVLPLSLLKHAARQLTASGPAIAFYRGNEELMEVDKYP